MNNASPEQLAVFDRIQHSDRSLVIKAVAGSGKTTTIVEACKYIPPTKLSVFLAFNKSIATELQSRLPSHIQAKTFHSHCFAALSRSLPTRPRVEGDKTRLILKSNLSEKNFWTYAQYVQRLVGYAKNHGIGLFCEIEDTAEWQQLIDYFAMVAPTQDLDESEAIRIAQETLTQSNADTKTIDFDDMIYLCALRGCTFDKCGYVFVDEAQDTNGVQRMLLKRMIGPTGRIIAVGDDAQAIYAFRGASADALDQIKDDFDCEELWLSFSWRCARSVVKFAQNYVPEIQPAPTAPEGSVIHEFDRYHESNFDPKSVILCRVTAPLVSIAFGFIRRNRGVRILGREIGQGLIALVKKMNTKDIDEMLKKLEVYRAREYNKFLERNQEALADAVNDRVSCIRIFADALPETHRTINDLTSKIDELFSDKAGNGLLTLCSIHKAKGLEWNTVNILDFNKYMPSKWARQDWQRKQERNLIYVAVTRAKSTLRFIESGDWRPEAVVPAQNEAKPFEYNPEQAALDML